MLKVLVNTKIITILIWVCYSVCLCLPQFSQSLGQFILLHGGLGALADGLLGGAGQVHVQLQAGLVRGLPHQVLHAVLGDVGGRALAHRSLHHARLHVQVLKLLLELIHQPADLLQVHALHGSAHALHDTLVVEEQS